MDTSNRLLLYIEPGCLVLAQQVGGVWTQIGSTAWQASTQGVWCDMRVRCDGAHIEVWRGARGTEMTQIITTDSCTLTSTRNFVFNPLGNANFCFDNIWIEADDLRTTWVYEYDDANEQTAMRVYDTATAYNDMMFTYDDWGRMVTRAISDHTATFSYRGDKLAWIASTFPDEAANLGFNQDGMGKLRVIQKNYGDPTWLRSDRGWNYAGLYHGTAGTWNVGSRSVRYTHDPSSVGGAPLAQTNIDAINGDTFMNVERDRLGSARRARTESTSSLLEREYGPYGESYTDDGADVLPGYTGHLLVNDGADYPLFYAPYRSYSPNSARWMARAPLGMVDAPNLYGYAHGNPLVNVDLLGLSCSDPCIDGWTNCIRSGQKGSVCTECMRRSQGQDDPWPNKIYLFFSGWQSCGPGPDSD